MMSFLREKNKLDFLKRFKKSETGAVTVEFVALTGGIIIVGLTAANLITGRVSTSISNLPL